MTALLACCVCQTGAHPVRDTRFGCAAICDACLKAAEEHADRMEMDERDYQTERLRDIEAGERSDDMVRRGSR